MKATVAPTAKATTQMTTRRRSSARCSPRVMASAEGRAEPPRNGIGVGWPWRGPAPPISSCWGRRARRGRHRAPPCRQRSAGAAGRSPDDAGRSPRPIRCAARRHSMVAAPLPDVPLPDTPLPDDPWPDAGCRAGRGRRRRCRRRTRSPRRPGLGDCRLVAHEPVRARRPAGRGRPAGDRTAWATSWVGGRLGNVPRTSLSIRLRHRRRSCHAAPICRATCGSFSGPRTMSAMTRMTSSFAGLSDSMSARVYDAGPRRNGACDPGTGQRARPARPGDRSADQ